MVSVQSTPTNLRQFLNQRVSIRAGSRGLVGTVVEVGKDTITVRNDKTQAVYTVQRAAISGVTRWTT